VKTELAEALPGGQHPTGGVSTTPPQLPRHGST